MTTDLTLEVTDLTKTYGELLAVDRACLEVRRGEIFGFLGPNGAGETTPIRMLTGLSRPTKGQAHILGLDLCRDLPRIKKQIDVVPEVPNLTSELPARDNPIFMGQLHGTPRRAAGLPLLADGPESGSVAGLCDPVLLPGCGDATATAALTMVQSSDWRRKEGP